MAFWKKLLGSDGDQRVDYYDEGVGLLEDGKFHEALTSFRLALKAAPGTRSFFNRSPSVTRGSG